MDRFLLPMVVLLMHGVHGAGKSLLSRILSEDFGYRLIVTDAAEHFPEVIDFHPVARQTVYVNNSLMGLSRALELSRSGRRVVLDFAPRHSIPYMRWFFREDPHIAESLISYVESMSSLLERELPSERVHVFLVIEDDMGVVVERIRRRAREGFLDEEVREEYIGFIDRELKALARNLEERGERVAYIPADGTLFDKLSALYEAGLIGNGKFYKPANP